MQATHFIHKRLSQGNKFWAVRPNSLYSFYAMTLGKGSSHLDHDFALARFDNEIRQDEFAQVCDSFPARRPCVCLPSRVFRVLFGSSLAEKSSKCIYEPIDKAFVGAGNLDIGLKVRNFGLWVTTKVTNVNTAFSVNNPCKIGKLSDGILFSKIVIAIHRISLYGVLYGNYTLQNKVTNVQPQRLSPLGTSNGICDSLNPFERLGVGINKTYRQLNNWSQK